MHYEACKLVFQPLSLLTEQGPEYLMLSKKELSIAELVKAIDIK